jgi:hypothetical protein
LRVRLGRVVAAGAALLLGAVTACRAIIGYDPLVYGNVPDATPMMEAGPRHDAAKGDTGVVTPHPDASCPAVKLTTLFTTSKSLQTLLLSSEYVYADIINVIDPESDAGVIPDPYVGLVACKKKGCGGSPETIVDYKAIESGSAWGSAAATDAGLLYALPTSSYDPQFSDAGAGLIETADPDGGHVHVVASKLGYPLLVVAAQKHVYWTDDPYMLTDSDAGASWSVRVDDDSPDAAPSSLFMRGFPSYTFALFSDSTNVYAVAGDDHGGVGLFLCPLLGDDGKGGCSGKPQEFISGSSLPIAEGTTVFDGVDSFAADGQYVYQAGYATGEITRHELSGNASTTLARGQSSASNLAVSGGELFWSTPGGLISHVAKDGTGEAAVLACAPASVVSLAVDDSQVYFITTDPNNSARTEVASVPLP